MLSYKEGQVASMSYSYQLFLSEMTFLLFEAEELVFLIPLDAGVPGGWGWGGESRYLKVHDALCTLGLVQKRIQGKPE